METPYFKRDGAQALLHVISEQLENDRATVALDATVTMPDGKQRRIQFTCPAEKLVLVSP